MRLLHAYLNPKTRRYEPPSEPTIRRMLKQVPAADFDAEVTAWMQAHEHQQTTPALNRFCSAHRNAAIHWLMSPNPSF